MASTPSVRVVKTFTYRGVTRQFSNRYHFNGGVPANDSAWHTLFDNITTAEQAIYPASCEVVEAFGYAAGSDVPVSSKTYTKTGTLSTTGLTQAPGDCAVLLRYATAARTSKNHPVYLFNYFHGALFSVGVVDTLATSQRTAVGTYANSWISGFSDGSVTYNRAGPNGASATGQLVDSMITHRDFPN